MNKQASEQRETEFSSYKGQKIYYDGILYFIKVNNINVAVDINKIKIANGGNISGKSSNKQYRGKVDSEINSKTKISKSKRRTNKKTNKKKMLKR